MSIINKCTHRYDHVVWISFGRLYWKCTSCNKVIMPQTNYNLDEFTASFPPKGQSKEVFDHVENMDGTYTWKRKINEI